MREEGELYSERETGGGRGEWGEREERRGVGEASLGDMEL